MNVRGFWIALLTAMIVLAGQAYGLTQDVSASNDFATTGSTASAAVTNLAITNLTVANTAVTNLVAPNNSTGNASLPFAADCTSLSVACAMEGSNCSVSNCSVSCAAPTTLTEQVAVFPMPQHLPAAGSYVATLIEALLSLPYHPPKTR